MCDQSGARMNLTASETVTLYFHIITFGQAQYWDLDSDHKFKVIVTGKTDFSNFKPNLKTS